MASIQTSIELQDNFTRVLHQVINSVNMGLAAMEDLHHTMNAPVETASIEATRNSINDATAAVRELDAAMQGVRNPDMPSAPVNVPVPEPASTPAPVQWQAYTGPEVFTTTGIERFNQEVQSANTMLNTLNATQSRIAQAASQTNVLPPNAINDINGVGSRLQAIQERIQQIENNPMNMGTAGANAGLEQLRGQLNQAVLEQENLNRAIADMDVTAANEAYQRLTQTVGSTEQYIRDNTDAQGRFNQTINEGSTGANNLMNSIGNVVLAYATLQTGSKVLGLSDTLTSTTARLDMMNDGLQTTQELQDMIFQSAERSRGSYQKTADAVSKLGTLAGNAFGSSAEVVGFMEQVNKQFVIAGTSTQGIEAAMLQLTQAMGSGILRGQEFNAVFQQAPNIMQSIADYMDVPIGKLKDMAAKGEITADVVKAAVFAAADETNAKFESMPKTFAQIWDHFKNYALRAFEPVLTRLNEFANSAGFEEFVDTAIAGVAILADTVVGVFELIGSIGGFVADNWSLLAPIIYSVIAALAIYNGYLAVTKAIEIISIGAKIALAIASYAHAAATGAEVSATTAATAAQYGLNTALLACPITWIVILIIALIALFYLVIAAINKFAGTSISATGIICGVFAAAVAFIANIFFALINFVIDIFVTLWNFIGAFANFFANVFNDPIAAIARLFFDLADTVLSLLESLASAIDTIFGSNLSGAVSGWRDSLGGWVDSTFGQGTEVMAKVNASDYHLERLEYKGAWDSGYNFGKGIENSVANFDPKSLFNADIPGASSGAGAGGISNLGDEMAGVGDNTGKTADNTGAIKDSLDITQEDLKYLRDIAEQEAINRFTTAEINIAQTNNNNISSSMDLDGVVSGLTDAVNEAVGTIAEGVHM